ncbi:MAG TPA: transcriptional regulator NrdR [Thermoanaerobaculia bacterium]|jgi:transcriptional repressor NrdR|nr:transcriptional regulator NrdR [Thermoanaerobaculia bacterium]
MKCPFCGAVDDRVVDSRESREGEVIRRRRECESCGRRFTSYETIEEIPYMVVKKDGRREQFDRKKLRAGLVKACEKRPISPAQLDTIVDEVETQLHDTEEREMSTSDIGARVMERLRELDKVAYVRFASVYRKFEDVDEFLRELKNLLGRADAKATP